VYSRSPETSSASPTPWTRAGRRGSNTIAQPALDRAVDLAKVPPAAPLADLRGWRWFLHIFVGIVVRSSLVELRMLGKLPFAVRSRHEGKERISAFTLVDLVEDELTACTGNAVHRGIVQRPLAGPRLQEARG